MKTASKLLVLFVLVSIVLMGCNSQGFTDPDKAKQAIEHIRKNTEKAINDKELKLARELWSQISEYGVKFEEQGQDGLAGSLKTLASCYLNLVNYLESGDQKQLEVFRKNYTKALEDLEKVVEKQYAK